MMDFGFSLSPSSAIDLDKVDTRLYEKLCSLSPDARTCMGCGSCSATCTAGPYSGMSLRKVILGLQRGTRKWSGCCPRLHALRQVHDGLPAGHQYAAADPDPVPFDDNVEE